MLMGIGILDCTVSRRQGKSRRSIRVRFTPSSARCWSLFTEDRGGEPLTPGDIAEIIVFGATRRENVVLADSLVFPSHQVCPTSSDTVCGLLVFGRGQRLDLVTARQHGTLVQIC
jgi:hypothetical protein